MTKVSTKVSEARFLGQAPTIAWLALIPTVLSVLGMTVHGAEPARAMAFKATNIQEATGWQRNARTKLFQLMMGGVKPKSGPLDPRLIRREEPTNSTYQLEEWSLQTLPDRRVHTWMAVPKKHQGKLPAVLALHGHGGSGEQVVRGQGLYWYGRKLAEMGYVVISPDIGQHTLQHPRWSLMGERTWDAIRCVDYLATRLEVDSNRIAVAGLSLGGETTMYVAALDPRIKAACSSGWLTTVENMKHGHCPCWNFPELEAQFDFADIFACFAPRPMVFEIGEKERAPGGFPLDIARQAFAEVREVYSIFYAETNVHLVAHPEGHVFQGEQFWRVLEEAHSSK